MKDLLNLLNKFRNSLNSDTTTKEAIQEVLKDKVRVNIKKENIFLKNGVLELVASPTMKSEIALKEEQVRNILKMRGIIISRIIYK